MPFIQLLFVISADYSFSNSSNGVEHHFMSNCLVSVDKLYQIVLVSQHSYVLKPTLFCFIKSKWLCYNLFLYHSPFHMGHMPVCNIVSIRSTNRQLSWDLKPEPQSPQVSASSRFPNFQAAGQRPNNRYI